MIQQPLGLLGLPGAGSAGASVGTVEPAHLVSWGLGVESSAYLTEIVTAPDHRGVELSQLIVIHSVVGSEWESTISDAEQFIIPLLADRGVRTVQVARNGPRDADGIVILDDSRRPTRIHKRGPWTLEGKHSGR